jgi:hypothetical protein
MKTTMEITFIIMTWMIMVKVAVGVWTVVINLTRKILGWKIGMMVVGFRVTEPQVAQTLRKF